MITLNEMEVEVLVTYLGGIRLALEYLDEVLQNEPELQALDEQIEEFLNDKGVFI